MAGKRGKSRRKRDQRCEQGTKQEGCCADHGPLWKVSQITGEI